MFFSSFACEKEIRLVIWFFEKSNIYAFLASILNSSNRLLIYDFIKASSVNGTLDRRSNQNGTLSRVCRSLVQNGLNNIGGNDTLTKYQGQLVYPGMTATLDDHSIQPISYSRRNIDKSTSMRMNWTQAASYKRQVSTGTNED